MIVGLRSMRPVLGWAIAFSLFGPVIMPDVRAQTTSSPEPIATSPQTLPVVYVDVASGSDESGDGSQLSPFKTITHALKRLPPGAVLQLAAGEYSAATGEQFPIVLERVHLVGNPGTRGEDVKIVGGGKHVSPTFASQDVTIVVGKEVSLRGVTVTNLNNRGKGLWIESTSPVIAQSSFVGSSHDGIFITGTSRARISDNYFSKNVADGLTAADQSAPLIENNVFEQTGFGINVTGKAQPRIIGNTIRNNADGIVVEGRSLAVLRNNAITANRRSGVAVVLLASVDLGTESEPGNNRFAENGQTDVNNVTRPAVELTAFGNQWDKPRITGTVRAETEVLEIAARNATPPDQYWVLVQGSTAAKLRAIPDFELNPNAQKYAGKSYLRVASYGNEGEASQLAQDLAKRGLKAIAVKAPSAKPPAAAKETPASGDSSKQQKPQASAQATTKETPKTPASGNAQSQPKSQTQAAAKETPKTPASGTAQTQPKSQTQAAKPAVTPATPQSSAIATTTPKSPNVTAAASKAPAPPKEAPAAATSTTATAQPEPRVNAPQATAAPATAAALMPEQPPSAPVPTTALPPPPAKAEAPAAPPAGQSAQTQTATETAAPAGPSASPVQTTTPAPAQAAPAANTAAAPASQPAPTGSQAAPTGTQVSALPSAARPAATGQSYRVLVGRSSDADVERLKEVVEQVIPQTYEGRSFLQVGVFSSEENANRLLETLTSKGFEARIVPVKPPG